MLELYTFYEYFLALVLEPGNILWILPGVSARAGYILWILLGISARAGYILWILPGIYICAPAFWCTVLFAWMFNVYYWSICSQFISVFMVNILRLLLKDLRSKYTVRLRFKSSFWLTLPGKLFIFTKNILEKYKKSSPSQSYHRASNSSQKN